MLKVFIVALVQLGVGTALEQGADHDESVAVAASVSGNLQRTRALMRRERGSKASSDPLRLHSSPEGQIALPEVEVHNAPLSNVEDFHLKAAQQALRDAARGVHDWSSRAASLKKLQAAFQQGALKESARIRVHEGGSDLCNDNYVRGALNQSNCPKAAPIQKRIEEPSMCMEAAREKCPDESCIGDPFVIGDTYFNNYPARCFMTKDGGKFHFNPVGYEPNMLTHANTVISYPVCVEPEYHNGTQNGNGGCPDGFAIILHEATCRTAATCLAYCPEEQFRVLNDTDDSDAPIGCHINAKDGCVKFNSMPNTGATIRGTPICNLTVARGSEGRRGGKGGGGAGNVTSF